MAESIQYLTLPQLVICEQCGRTQQNLKATNWWLVPCRFCGHFYGRNLP